MDTSRTVNDGEEKRRFRQGFVKNIRPGSGLLPTFVSWPLATERHSNFEFITALTEAHPIVPFEHCSFGSDRNLLVNGQELLQLYDES